jgi:hypothetical protein
MKTWRFVARDRYMISPLNLLSRESKKAFQELAEEAFRDSCKSTHGRRFEGGAAGKREGCGFREARIPGGIRDGSRYPRP